MRWSAWALAAVAENKMLNEALGSKPHTEPGLWLSNSQGRRQGKGKAETGFYHFS